MAAGTVSVGIASSVVLGADPTRIGLLLQNLSANDVYINFGAAAALNSGLHLVPNMALPIILDGRVLGLDITGSINAIASAANSLVYGIDTRAQ